MSSISFSSFTNTEVSIPSASSLSRQCTQNRSSSTDTVMVPGVSVMELASRTRASPVLKSVSNYTKAGSG